jgi:histidine phosphotransferase ChpT
MSGTSSPEIANPIPAPDTLELAALLCSKVCHDLISPVGAIVNGLRSARRQSEAGRPRVCARADPQERQDRLPRGCNSAGLPLAQPVRRARRSISATRRPWRAGHIEDAKTSITWNLPRLLLPEEPVKLLLNMMVIAQQTIPRGGMLTVEPIGQGESMSFRVAATGLNARLPQNIVSLLAGAQQSTIDAHAVQPYYTRLLAAACGLKVTLVAEGDAMVVQAA